MKIRKGNNRGVTLVEIMIAIAILAMVMTAVIMLMSNNTVVYRKTKADINVQTTAQETYTTIQESVMQATSIRLTGWIGEKVEDSVRGSFDGDADTYIKADPEEDNSLSKLNNLGTDKHFYPSKMEIDYSIRSKRKNDGTYEKLDNVTCTVTYYFVRYGDESNPRCNVYMTRSSSDSSYTSKWGDSDPDPTADNMDDDEVDYDQYLLTSSLAEVYFDVNAEAQTIGMDFSFNDKNMTYHTDGIVEVRNSFVMCMKPDRLTAGSEVSTESSS